MRPRYWTWAVAATAVLCGCAPPAGEAPPPPPAPVPEVAEPEAAPPPVASPAPAPEGPWAPVLESETDWIRALKERLPRSWAAHEPEPHLVILYDREVKEARVREMGKEVARLLKDVVAPRFPPATPIDRVFLFRVCRDRAQFLQYGGPPDAVGYWSERDGECVLYEDRTSRQDTLRTLRSIAVLQYLHLAGAPGTHAWFRVGVSTALSQPGARGTLKPHRWWAGKAKGLRRGREFAALWEFVRMGPAEVATMAPEVHASQAWSFAWFVIEKPSSRWSDLLDRYYLAHRDHLASAARTLPGGPPDRRWASEESLAAARAAGLEAAFGGLDEEGWKRLEKEWRGSL